MVYLDDKPFPAAGLTLLELLQLAGRDAALCVVTVDGRFVPRPEYRELVLPDEARVKTRELPGGG